MKEVQKLGKREGEGETRRGGEWEKRRKGRQGVGASCDGCQSCNCCDCFQVTKGRGGKGEEIGRASCRVRV